MILGVIRERGRGPVNDHYPIPALGGGGPRGRVSKGRIVGQCVRE